MLRAGCIGVIDLGQRATRLRIALLKKVASKVHNPHIMEAVYFTLTAIACYVIADWVLKRIEAMAGRTFEHRTLIFFAIILSLAMVSFALIRNLFAT